MSNTIEIFGNYILLQKIASGGMAEVFLARPAVREGDGRLLVIKRILPNIANHAEFLNMFHREIQIIMGFTHSQVVQLHDFGSVQGQPYIAMEFVEGKSLRDICEKLKSKNVKMPVPVALSLAAQAASGLHYAHSFVHKTSGKPLHTIHRDISPHNLLVSYDGNLKIIDFGIAKAAAGSAHDLTQAGTVKGKAGYFSPEQLAGQNIDGRTDIFSLGVVAWELLTGEKLFAKPGDSEVNVMIKVTQCEKYITAPSRVNREIPAAVDKIILKALEKDPAKRYRDAREFQGELRRALMQNYPAYTYADTGQLVNVLFAQERETERRQIGELNKRAQEMLVGRADDKTVSIDLSGKTPAMAAPMTMAMGPHDKTTEEIVAQRLTRIEAALLQKASFRHYVMLAFYIVSLFAIKFGDRYSYWFDLGTQKAKASEMAALNVAPPKPPSALQKAATTALRAAVQPAVPAVRPPVPAKVQTASARAPTTRNIAQAAKSKMTTAKAKKPLAAKPATPQ